MAQSKSLLNNFLYHFARTLAGFLFPLVTFTYSARILGVDGVGQLNFSRAIISYFVMIAMLGMNHYGTREAAKRRDDRDSLSRFVHEMLFINGITTAIAYLLFFVTIAAVPKFRTYETLLLMCSLSILLQGTSLEWLYQAQEEYRYITVCSVLFQLTGLAAMFLFVKDATDVVPYAATTLVASTGTYVVNLIHARKYVGLHWYGHYEIRKHLRPLLWLFAMAMSTEVYTALDSTMLGFLQGDTAVGKYAAAVKVNKMVISLLITIGTVVTPRLSYYVGNGEGAKMRELSRRVYNYVFMLSVPAAVGLFMLSDDIILMFSGNEFASAGLTMRLLTPIVVFIPFSMVTNQQTLIPIGKEKMVFISTMMGAITNFSCNLLLIPRFAENGAAAATLFAETAVAIVCFINASRFFEMKQVLRHLYQYLIGAAPIPLIMMLIQHLNVHYLLRTALVVTISAGCYFSILFLFKNSYFMEAVAVVQNKLTGKQTESK